MLTNGLVALLASNSEITSVVGSRIQPMPAPEDLTQYPCITYQTVSDVAGYTLTGIDGVANTRVIFNCFALRYLDAHSLALLMKSALAGYRGTLNDGSVVYETQVVNITDSYVDGSRIYKVSVHVVLTYAE